MSKRQFRWSDTALKNRMKRHKPVWLWKWTADAAHKYKESR